MKKFLFALLLLPFISKAQVLPIGASKGTVRVLGKLSSDTLLILPNSDTTTAPKILGGVIMKTSDKKIYVYTGTKWAATSEGAVVSESDPTVPAFLKLIVPADTVRWAMAYVDSVKRVGLNVYTYKNGAATLAYTDSIANVSGKLDSIRRSSDSVYWYAGGSRFFAFKDSTGGEANTGANMGSGAQVFQAKVGLELRFKTILSGNGNITITPGTNDITLTGKSFVDSVRKKAGTDSVFFYTNGTGSFGFRDSAIAGGEINTISSVGSGTSIVKGKTGVDLQLKSLTSDTTIALTGNTNDVQVKVDQTRIASVGRLADTATAIRATIAAGDTIYVRDAGTGTSLFYIQGDTLKLKKVNGVTQNADSSLTFSGGGGGTPGGSNTQIQFNNSSAFGGDAGLTYNSTTNELTTDSIKSKTVYGDSGVFVPQGRYDYDNSFWRPGIRFIGENKTGIARLSGITTFIDNGAKNVGIWREGADTDVIFGYGANRLTVEATGSMNHVSLVGRMEFEGLGNGGYIDWVGYQAGSSLGRTIRITTDATIYGNSVVPIHFVPRNGFHAFRITDSVNAVKMHFSSQGWLGIGNDTAQRAIHVRNNGDVYERLESLSLTGIIGHEYYVQGNEKWSNKIDINSGQITENIGSGGYFKRWQINGTNAIGLDADRSVFVNNRLFVGTTSSLGIGEKLAVNGTIAIADGNQVVEPSGLSGFRISTSAGTDIFYGSGATQGKVQMNPHMSYIYNSLEKFRVSSAGEVWINPAGVADLGSYTLQNTGGLYQQGSFRLGGTRVATSNDVKLLVKGESDSTVAALDFPIVQTSYSPTKTDVTNIGTASVTTSYYQRTGNKIEVWGEVTIDPTATGDTQITLSLPIASSITNSYDLSGSAAAYDVNQSARIYHSAGVAVVRLNATDASSHVYSYRYVYYYIAP